MEQTSQPRGLRTSGYLGWCRKHRWPFLQGLLPLTVYKFLCYGPLSSCLRLRSVRLDMSAASKPLLMTGWLLHHLNSRACACQSFFLCFYTSVWGENGKNSRLQEKLFRIWPWLRQASGLMVRQREAMSFH